MALQDAVVAIELPGTGDALDLEYMRRGESVREVDDEEITAQEAVDPLKLSRSYLVGSEARQDPVAQGGRRAPNEAVRRLSLPRSYGARRLNAVAESAAEAQELGVY